MVEPTPGLCLLCGCPGTVAAVVVSTRRTAEAPEGEVCVVPFLLCSICHGEGPHPPTDKLRQIEKVVRFHMTGVPGSIAGKR